jgi:hypothetical protein
MFVEGEISYITPSPSHRLRTPHSDSTKQKNMRNHVMERNREFYYADGKKPNRYKCDICQEETNKPGDYINSHVVAHCYARTLKLARRGNIRLPYSPSYVCNGLFLCRQCDKHFEDHFVTISGDGTISVDEGATPRRVYQPLKNTKVPWFNMIDASSSWPNSATLIFRNGLLPVLGEHRKLDYGVEADDVSTGTEAENILPTETEDIIAGKRKKKRNRYNVLSGKVEATKKRKRNI